MTDFTPCTKTIRLCIEHIPRSWHGKDTARGAYEHQAYDNARDALEALLPDPAEELAWRAPPMVGHEDLHHSYLPRLVKSLEEWSAKLINQGKVRP